MVRHTVGICIWACVAIAAGFPAPVPAVAGSEASDVSGSQACGGEEGARRESGRVFVDWPDVRSWRPPGCREVLLEVSCHGGVRYEGGGQKKHTSFAYFLLSGTGEVQRLDVPRLLFSPLSRYVGAFPWDDLMRWMEEVCDPSVMLEIGIEAFVRMAWSPNIPLNAEICSDKSWCWVGSDDIGDLPLSTDARQRLEQVMDEARDGRRHTLRCVVTRVPVMYGPLPKRGLHKVVQCWQFENGMDERIVAVESVFFEMLPSTS